MRKRPQRSLARVFLSLIVIDILLIERIVRLLYFNENFDTFGWVLFMIAIIGTLMLIIKMFVFSVYQINKMFEINLIRPRYWILLPLLFIVMFASLGLVGFLIAIICYRKEQKTFTNNNLMF